MHEILKKTKHNGWELKGVTTEGDRIQRFTKSVLCSHETQNTVVTKLSQSFDGDLKSNDGAEILSKKQPPSNGNLQNNNLSEVTDVNRTIVRPDDPIEEENWMSLNYSRRVPPKRKE